MQQIIDREIDAKFDRLNEKIQSLEALIEKKDEALRSCLDYFEFPKEYDYDHRLIV